MKIKRISINESQRKAIAESGKDSGLTLEAVNKISDYIEASMNSKIVEIGKALKAEAVKHFGRKYKALATEAVKRNNSATLKKMDMYLEHVVNKWYTKNKAPVDVSINSLQNKRIVEGILGLFESNYMNVPAGKENAIKEIGRYAAKLEKISESKNEKLLQASSEIAKLKKFALTEAAARKLTDTQREKLFEMSKQIRAKTVKEFKEKILNARKIIMGRTSQISETRKPVNNVDRPARTQVQLTEDTSGKPAGDLISSAKSLLRQ